MTRAARGGHISRTPASLCPHCGQMLSGACSMEDRRTPEPGDLTVCVGCARPLIYTGALTTRAVPADELERIFAAEPEIAAMVAATMRLIDAFQSIPRLKPPPPTHH